MKVSKSFVLVTVGFVLAVLLILITETTHRDRYILSAEQSHELIEKLAEDPKEIFNPDMPRCNVLIIHSYQYEMLWSQNITRGVRGYLTGRIPNFHLNVEFINSREFPSQMNSESYIANLKEKYAPIRFNVIICTDNNALKFMNEHGKYIFGDVPLVFCGVNDFVPEMMSNYTQYTGVIEKIDLAGTIELARALNPKVKKVYLVNDKTPTSLAIKRDLSKDLENLSKDYEIEFLADYTHTQLARKISNLSKDSIVVIMVWQIDSEGVFLKHREAAGFLSSSSNVPVYSLWGLMLGRGIVGGSLMTGLYQGQTAAALAEKVILGEKASDIPIVRDPVFYKIADYEQIKRFDLDEANLPDGTILVNYPISFFVEYRNLILISISIFIFLVFIILLLIVNVNRRRSAQIQLASNQVKLKSFVVELAAKNEELESIIYASHHDLRSPIVNINGFAHELEESCRDLRNKLDQIELDPQSREMFREIIDSDIPVQVDQIITNSEKMSHLQSSLLEVSKIGKQHLNFEIVDVNEVVYDILENIREIRDGEVDVFIKSLPTCLGDKKMLETVFHNIIENAIKFRSPQRHCEITIYGVVTAGEVCYNIEDNGIGIETKHQRDIFRLFYQLNPSTDEMSNGLGLTIAKRIVTRHNGKLEISSKLGRGSTFTIRLPLELSSPQHSSSL